MKIFFFLGYSIFVFLFILYCSSLRNICLFLQNIRSFAWNIFFHQCELLIIKKIIKSTSLYSNSDFTNAIRITYLFFQILIYWKTEDTALYLHQFFIQPTWKLIFISLYFDCLHSPYATFIEIYPILLETNRFAIPMRMCQFNSRKYIATYNIRASCYWWNLK